MDYRGTRRSVVGWGIILQAWMSRFRFPLILTNRNVSLGFTQPLTEMNSKILPQGKRKSARKAHNLTAICESIVYKMWEPRRLTTLWVSTVDYRDSITFYICYSRS
jgi:hypothetical protein